MITKRCLPGGLACGTFMAALAMAVLGSPDETHAQGFPERTVRIIVPTAPAARSTPPRAWSGASSPSRGASRS